MLRYGFDRLYISEVNIKYDVFSLVSVLGPVSSLTESFQNSTTVCITWQPPPRSNKQITSYQISYWLTENRTGTLKSESVSGNETSFCFPVPKEVEEGQEIAVEVGIVENGGSGRSSAINVTITSSSSGLEPPNTAGKHKLKILSSIFCDNSHYSEIFHSYLRTAESKLLEMQ